MKNQSTRTQPVLPFALLLLFGLLAASPAARATCEYCEPSGAPLSTQYSTTNNNVVTFHHLEEFVVWESKWDDVLKECVKDNTTTNAVCRGGGIGPTPFIAKKAAYNAYNIAWQGIGCCQGNTPHAVERPAHLIPERSAANCQTPVQKCVPVAFLPCLNCDGTEKALCSADDVGIGSGSSSGGSCTSGCGSNGPLQMNDLVTGKAQTSLRDQPTIVGTQFNIGANVTLSKNAAPTGTGTSSTSSGGASGSGSGITPPNNCPPNPGTPPGAQSDPQYTLKTPDGSATFQFKPSSNPNGSLKGVLLDKYGKPVGQVVERMSSGGTLETLVEIELNNLVYVFPDGALNSKVFPKKLVSPQYRLFSSNGEDIQTDYTGFEVVYGLDTDGRISTLTDSNGLMLMLHYEGSGSASRLHQVTGGGLASPIIFVRDNDRVISRTTSRGTDEFHYDPVSQVMNKIVHAEGRTNTFDIVATQSITNEFGEVLLLVHSEPTANPSQGLLPPPDAYLPATATSAAARVSFALGGMNGTNPVWRSYTHFDPVSVYDSELGQVYSETTLDPEGRVREVLRDKPSNFADSHVLLYKSITAGVTNYTRMWYDSSWNVTNRVSMSDQRPLATDPGLRREYDPHNRLIASTDELGVTTRYRYYSEAEGDFCELVEATWKEKDGVTNEFHVTTYHPTTQPSYLRLKPVSESVLHNGAWVAVKTFDYVNADAVNPQNIGKIKRIDYHDDTFESFAYGCCGPTNHVTRIGGTNVYEYVNGLLLSSAAPGTVPTTRTYDAFRRLKTVTNPDGSMSTNTYDPQGRVVRVDYSNGPLHGLHAETHYRLDGRLTHTVDAHGVISTNEYDLSTGDLLKTYTVLPAVSTNAPVVFLTSSVTNTPNGEIYSETDVRGLTVIHGYDAEGRRTTTTWPDQTFTLSVFDDFGRLESTTDRTNRVTRYRYDIWGRRFEVEGPDHIIHRTHFDEYGRVSSRVVDPNVTNTVALVTQFKYDPEGRLVKVIYSDDSFETTAYHQGEHHRQTRRTDRHGHTTITEVDAAGRIVRAFLPAPAPGQPEQTISTATYDSQGRPASNTGPDGVTVTTVYGRKIMSLAQVYGPHHVLVNWETLPAFPSSLSVLVTTNQLPDTTFSVTYTGPHGVLVQKDRGGAQTSYVHDSLGRVVQQIDNAGHSVRFAYDASGQMTDLWDQRGSHTRWTYNTEGQLERKTYHDNSHIDYTYYPDGQLASRHTPRDILTSYLYDSAGRLQKVDYPHDTDILYTYDAFGRKDRVTHAGGEDAWTFDLHGSLDTETLAATGYSDAVLDYTYLRGRLMGYSHTNVTATYVYDALGRIKTITHANGVYGYDFVGASAKIAVQRFNDSLIVTNQFDTLGRLLKKTNRAPANGPEISSYAYGYDDHDRRTSVTRKDGMRIDYGYDDIGQLTSAVRKFPGPGDATDYSYNYHYQYDPAGNPVDRKENGQRTTYLFNALNQHATGNVHTAATSTDAAGLLARPQGESVTVTVNGQAAELYPVPSGLYDSTSNYLSLVAALNAGADSLAWHAQDVPLSPGSNQIKVRAAIASGRVLEQTNTVTLATAPTFGYDANGNMSNDSHFVYTWNDEDRMVSAVPVALTNGARKVEHVYDWMGRRILRVVSKHENGAWTHDNTTRYVYQDWNVIWETITHAQGSLETNSYSWGLDLSGTPQGAGGVGGLLAIQFSPLPIGENHGAGSPNFTVYDGNGNVMQYTSAQGVLLAKFEYTPFGTEIQDTGPGTKRLTYRFSTKPECDVIGAGYFGFRFFASSGGRWLNKDPMSSIPAINKIVQILPVSQDYLEEYLSYLNINNPALFEQGAYTFSANNSISNIDKFGLIAWPWADDKKECKVKKEECLKEKLVPSVIAKGTWVRVCIQRKCWYACWCLEKNWCTKFPCQDPLCLLGHYVEMGPYTFDIPEWVKLLPDSAFAGAPRCDLKTGHAESLLDCD